MSTDDNTTRLVCLVNIYCTGSWKPHDVERSLGEGVIGAKLVTQQAFPAENLSPLTANRS